MGNQRSHCPRQLESSRCCGVTGPCFPSCVLYNDAGWQRRELTCRSRYFLSIRWFPVRLHRCNPWLFDEMAYSIPLQKSCGQTQLWLALPTIPRLAECEWPSKYFFAPHWDVWFQSMNKLCSYRCCEYIKMTKGHRVAVWGMEGTTLMKMILEATN